jgi:hypothetical protein
MDGASCRYIMSDCDAVSLIHDYIHYAPTSEDAVSYVMLAGTTVLHSSIIGRPKIGLLHHQVFIS